MSKTTARRGIKKTSIEFRSFSGKSGKYYLLVKGPARKSDFFNVFVAGQLKEACLDILGIVDTKQVREQHNANELARKVWM